MPLRRTKPSSRWPAIASAATTAAVWATKGFVVVASIVIGYCWRSYAPAPIDWDPRLSGESDSAVLKKERADATAASGRADKAEADARKLRAELASLKAERQQAETSLADLQIKQVLQGGGE